MYTYSGRYRGTRTQEQRTPDIVASQAVSSRLFTPAATTGMARAWAGSRSTRNAAFVKRFVAESPARAPPPPRPFNRGDRERASSARV